MTRRGKGALAISVLCAGGAFFFWDPRPKSESVARDTAPSATTPAAIEADDAPGRAPEVGLPGGPLVDALRARLSEAGLSEANRALFMDLTDEQLRRLDHPYGQMGFLEDLVRWLKQRHPQTWRSELRRLLEAAFPGRAAVMLARWDARESYEAWVQEQGDTLRGMSREERRAAMWERRRDFFGADTDALFEGAHRSEALGDALEALSASHEGTVPERFDSLLDSVQEQYGDDASSFVATRRTELINRFLDLEATQEDLDALDDAARYQALHQIREQAGMDAEALARWDGLDVERDRRWQTGEQYVGARDALLQHPQSAARDEALRVLRTEHFSAEMAEQIAHEERSGFFRFERRRVYGRN